MPGLITKIPKAQKHTPGLFASISNALLDLIFPPRCEHCNRVDFRWCDDCLADLNALPIDLQERRILNQLSAASTGSHIGLLQHAIHALKYANVPMLSKPLAERLINALHQLDWAVDCSVPVPMHPTRLAQRGYNQAALLARHLPLPMIDGLARIRETRSQVGLTREERLQNVQGAFLAKEDFNGKNVLLIDDVLTTGATLIGCTQALYQAGAHQVFALTVSQANS
ncbi:MAG: ComF family protein [Phototrophicales bacterium]